MLLKNFKSLVGNCKGIRMAKFVYKMENILSIKYKLEDQAKDNFAEAKNKLDLEEEKLDRLYQRKELYEEKLFHSITDQLNLLEIKKIEDAVEVIKYKIRIQIIEVNSAKQQLEIARIKLNEAMMERKTHEKLKEKAFDIFLQELNAEERKEVDELVSFMYRQTSEDK